jgi:hypothetical protein
LGAGGEDVWALILYGVLAETILNHLFGVAANLVAIFGTCCGLKMIVFKRQLHYQNPSIKAVRLAALFACGTVLFGALGQLFLPWLQLSPYPKHVFDSVTNDLQTAGLGALVTLIILKLFEKF